MNNLYEIILICDNYLFSIDAQKENIIYKICNKQYIIQYLEYQNYKYYPL